VKVNEDAEQHPADARLREMTAERDRWIRLFNRLEAAVARHRNAADGPFGGGPDVDEALHYAHARILKAAAER